MRNSLLPALALVLLVSGRVAAADKPAPSYSKDVKPFVANYCLECHGAVRPKAGLDLSTYDNLMKKSRRGSVVVASNPDQSLLFRTLTGNARQMPPAKYTKKPTAEEIAAVKAWIAAGANNDTTATPPAEKTETPDNKPRQTPQQVSSLPMAPQESILDAREQ